MKTPIASILLIREIALPHEIIMCSDVRQDLANRAYTLSLLINYPYTLYEELL